MTLKAPFPWFGGKSRVAPLVWQRLGDVPNYVEPFFGSGAVLLGRPHPPRIETVNDLDGFVANAWRAIAASPGEVARWADQPSFENDLHARHVWLKARRATLSSELEADPDFYDAKIAGWWLWGMAQWIGSGFCGSVGPWQVEEQADGTRQLVHLGDAGRGVSRQLVHLGDAGQGVSRKLVHLGDGYSHLLGVKPKEGAGLVAWMEELADRLRRVRVCCGDWSRICGPTPTFKHGLTGVFLDPPYSNDAGRDMNIYAIEDGNVAHDVREWAIANGDNPLMRIALCGYDTEHAMPSAWTAVPWKAAGGYGRQGNGAARANAEREVVWFSPHCLHPEHTQPALFALEEDT